MAQFECPRHSIPSVLSNFKVGWIPFSPYWPSGVIRGEYFNALGGHFSDSRPRPIYPFCSNSPLINYIPTSQIIIFYTHCQLFSTRNIPYNDVERQYILIIHWVPLIENIEVEWDSAKWVRWPRILREQGQFTHMAESNILYLLLTSYV